MKSVLLAYHRTKCGRGSQTQCGPFSEKENSWQQEADQICGWGAMLVCEKKAKILSISSFVGLHPLVKHLD